MKILAIGNSFSQDAMSMLSALGKANGEVLKCVNLYIPGCSLEQHYRNMLGGNRDYSFEINGITDTGIKISVEEALLSDCWDVVTLQQVSYLSPNYETYQPYLDALAEFVRKYAPKAKIYMHETWAYEEGSTRLNGELHYQKRKDMYSDIKNAYNLALKAINADGIIHCGAAFEESIKAGMDGLHRDTFHASLVYGRYLLALTWFVKLVKDDVRKDSYLSLGLELSEQQAEIALNTAHTVKNGI